MSLATAPFTQPVVSEKDGPAKRRNDRRKNRQDRRDDRRNRRRRN